MWSLLPDVCSQQARGCGFVIHTQTVCSSYQLEWKWIVVLYNEWWMLELVFIRESCWTWSWYKSIPLQNRKLVVNHYVLLDERKILFVLYCIHPSILDAWNMWTIFTYFIFFWHFNIKKMSDKLNIIPSCLTLCICCTWPHMTTALRRQAHQLLLLSRLS